MPAATLSSACTRMINPATFRLRGLTTRLARRELGFFASGIFVLLPIRCSDSRLGRPAPAPGSRPSRGLYLRSCTQAAIAPAARPELHRRHAPPAAFPATHGAHA